MNFSFATLSSVFAANPTWLPIADAVVKATVILASAAAASLALRKASAAARHFIWTVALIAALALPAVSLIVPRWQVPVVTVTTAPPTERSAVDVPAAIPPSRRDTASPQLATAAEPPRAAGSRSFSQASRPSWNTILAGLWLSGTLAVAARLFVGLLAVAWMSRRTERVVDAPWLPLARSLARQLGIRKLAFLRSPKTTMPMAWGIVSPAVLMPADADGWPVERLRIVLLHELAHVRRRDCLTHALAQLACAVHWFNPLVWFAARHLRTERERACDDLVLATGTRGSDYAEHLIEIARVMRAGRFPALVTGATLAMAHRSQLEGRLMAILDPAVPRAGLTRVHAMAATMLAVCGLTPIASVQPWAYAQQPSAEPVASVATSSEMPLPDQNAGPRPRRRPVPGPAPTAADVSTSVAAEASQEAATALHGGLLKGVIGGALGGALDGTVARVMDQLAGQRTEAAAQDRAPKADKRTVDALAAALKDSDTQVREAAMHALAQLRDPAVFDALVQALRDPSGDVREQAAFALGQLHDARALQPLTNVLKDQIAGVREQAAFALGQLGDRRAVAALASALSDSSDSVREQAVFALGQLRDPTAVDAIVQAVRDQKSNVREQAVFALGQIQDKRAVSPLISALKDGTPDVREQAAFALGQLRDAGAVEALIIALKDADVDVREQAAFALGQIRDPRAIDALTEALKDASPRVRQQAAFAIGQLAR